MSSFCSVSSVCQFKFASCLSLHVRPSLLFFLPCPILISCVGLFSPPSKYWFVFSFWLHISFPSSKCVSVTPCEGDFFGCKNGLIYNFCLSRLLLAQNIFTNRFFPEFKTRESQCSRTSTISPFSNVLDMSVRGLQETLQNTASTRGLWLIFEGSKLHLKWDTYSWGVK